MFTKIIFLFISILGLLFSLFPHRIPAIAINSDLIS